MSNKTLLNESQVRQFMKLAKLEPLASGFVEGLTGRTADEMEESHGRSPGEGAAGRGHSDQNSRNEGMGMYRDDDLEATEDELGKEDDIADEEGDEIDDLEADLGAEAPEAPADEGRMISVDDFLGALETALETAMGDEVEIDATEMSDEEDEVEADVEMDAADDMELDTDMEMDDEMLEEEAPYGGDEGDIPAADRKKKGHYGPGGKTKATAEEEDEVDYEKNESTEATDELVEQITKRVAARILKSALAKK